MLDLPWKAVVVRWHGVVWFCIKNLR